jgi:hypothetical protein
MSDFSKEFRLDGDILAPGSAAKLTISGSSDAGALAAILSDDKFPEGDIEIGRISFGADTGPGIFFRGDLVGGASLGFRASASVQSGLGVYDTPAKAIKALRLEDPPRIEFEAASGERCILMQWGYSLSGSVSASHPLGVLGAASFGVETGRDAAFIVLHCINANDGAHRAIEDTIASWRLPRHVEFRNGEVNLKPRTWLVVEADGSVAFKLAASLGYEMSFSHEAPRLGITRNLGARIDAGLRATFGFSVGGRYLLVLGRESNEPVIRLRLCKRSQKDLGFGLNLSVGVTGKTDFPKNSDALVKSIFGLHGLQVLRDLRDWADPKNDLGEKLAGLGAEAAFELLRRITGVHLPTEFEKARKVVADALNQWDKLPQRVSAMLWDFMSGEFGASATQELDSFLAALSNPDENQRRAALAQALARATFGDSPQGRFLEAIARPGLGLLGENLEDASRLAALVREILRGDVIGKLQSFIGERLNLDQIRKAVSDADFFRIDKWLVNRLGILLDKTLELDDLKEVQKALTNLDRKVIDYYKAGIQALIKRYSLEFAATYQATTSNAALIDVSFDLSNPAAAASFRTVVARSKFDDLLMTDTPGVTLRQATLTHGIRRNSAVELHLPFLDFTTTHLNEAVVSLTAEEHAGRLLVYQVDARDNVTAANRCASQLSVLGSMRVAAGEPPRLDQGGTVAYEMLQVKKAMDPPELEQRLSPFIRSYLGKLFGPGDSAMRQFFRDLCAAIAAAHRHGRGDLGDMALSMQVSLPASVIAGWLLPRDERRLHGDRMVLSRRLQAAWRRALPELYFHGPGDYAFGETAAALLVWSSLPVSTSVKFERGEIVRFNTDQDVFWNHPDVDLRRAIARDQHTIATLTDRLAVIRQWLRERDDKNPDMFAPERAGRFVELALNATGDIFYGSLLHTESQLVSGAAKALDEIAGALSGPRVPPSRVIKSLAGWVAELTDTFNSRLGSLYGGGLGRVLGPLALIEASSAIDPWFESVTPSAMLMVYALSDGHSFELGRFVEGQIPPDQEIVLTQTLVNL